MGRAVATVTEPYRRREFDGKQALIDFNNASAERARLSRLVFDLAGYACTRAVQRKHMMLDAFDSEIGLRPGFQTELVGPLREYGQIDLHTHLHRMLDEGQRLRLEDVERLADEAVLRSAAALLTERVSELGYDVHLSDSDWNEIFYRTLQHPTPSRKVLDANIAAVYSRVQVTEMLAELN